VEMSFFDPLELHPNGKKDHFIAMTQLLYYFGYWKKSKAVL
jgi:hypothetical protein